MFVILELIKCNSFSEAKSTIIHHNNQQQSQTPSSHTHTSHPVDTSTRGSPSERPYLGQTSLLPSTSTSTIKSEPGYEYSCLQNQSYPYQQLFGFSGSSPATPEVAYHHQHHVTAAAKLMASS